MQAANKLVGILLRARRGGFFIISFTEHVSTEWRTRDTQARFQMRNGIIYMYSTAPRGGGSRIKARASATAQLLAMAPRRKVAPGIPVSCLLIALGAAQAVYKPRRASAAPESLSPPVTRKGRLHRSSHALPLGYLPLPWFSVLRWTAITSHERLPPRMPRASVTCVCARQWRGSSTPSQRLQA